MGSSKPSDYEVLPRKVKLSELQLGDIVDTQFGEYSYATVRQIKDNIVTFVRPYIHTDDFSYTGGVLWYIGIEEFTDFAMDGGTKSIVLVRRKGELR